MSNIIKSTFVSLSEQKKKIEVISADSGRIINNNHIKIEEEFDINELDENIDFEEPSIPLHQSIVEEAQLEASRLLEEAQKKAKQIEEQAKDNGFNEGFQKGKQQALMEVTELKKQLQVEIQAAIDEREHLYHTVEPKIADIIHNLVMHMVGIQKFERETILYLIRTGLNEVEIQGDIAVRVSAQDYDEVMNGKEFLSQNYSEKINFEIIKDARLKSSDCIIETTLGSIDCSLDEKMEGLLRQLQLIKRSFHLE